MGLLAYNRVQWCLTVNVVSALYVPQTEFLRRLNACQPLTKYAATYMTHILPLVLQPHRSAKSTH